MYVEKLKIVYTTLSFQSFNPVKVKKSSDDILREHSVSKRKVYVKSNSFDGRRVLFSQLLKVN